MSDLPPPVERPVRGSRWSDDHAREAMQPILETLAQVTGFDVVGISGVRDDGYLHVLSLIGPPDARRALLDSLAPVEPLLEVLESADDWGSLKMGTARPARARRRAVGMGHRRTTGVLTWEVAPRRHPGGAAPRRRRRADRRTRLRRTARRPGAGRRQADPARHLCRSGRPRHRGDPGVRAPRRADPARGRRGRDRAARHRLDVGRRGADRVRRGDRGRVPGGVAVDPSLRHRASSGPGSQSARPSAPPGRDLRDVRRGRVGAPDRRGVRPRPPSAGAARRGGSGRGAGVLGLRVAARRTSRGRHGVPRLDRVDPRHRRRGVEHRRDRGRARHRSRPRTRAGHRGQLRARAPAGAGAPGAGRLQDPPDRDRLPRAADPADQHHRVRRDRRGRPRADGRVADRGRGDPARRGTTLPRRRGAAGAPPDRGRRAGREAAGRLRADRRSDRRSQRGAGWAAPDQRHPLRPPGTHLGPRLRARARAPRRQPGQQCRQVHRRRRTRRGHAGVDSGRRRADLSRRRPRHLPRRPGAGLRRLLPLRGPGRERALRHGSRAGDRAPGRRAPPRSDRARVRARPWQHLPGRAARAPSRRGCAAAAPRRARPARTRRGGDPRWRRGPGCRGPRRR